MMKLLKIILVLSAFVIASSAFAYLYESYHDKTEMYGANVEFSLYEHLHIIAYLPTVLFFLWGAYCLGFLKSLPLSWVNITLLISSIIVAITGVYNFYIDSSLFGTRGMVYSAITGLFYHIGSASFLIFLTTLSPRQKILRKEEEALK